MPVLLSDEEIEAMDGLPHLHRCLYIFGIRRYMDYSTGITGVKRKISYNSLSQEIYVEIRRGVKEDPTKSRDQIKRMLMLLEKAGLIKRKSIVTKKEKQLILECVLASTDNSVQNKAAPWPPHSPTLQAALDTETIENEENHYKSSDDNVGADTATDSESRPVSRPTQNGKAAIYPISVTNTNLLTNLLGDDLKIRSQPEADFLNLFVKYRLPINLLRPQAELLKMIGVWLGKGVTVEHAETKIKDKLSDNENLGITKRPSPLYFFERVIEYKQFLESADNLKEQTNEKPNRTHKQNNSTRPKYETPVERARRELQERAAERTKRTGRD